MGSISIMLGSKDDGETPLHRAVLNKDLDYLQQHSDDRPALMAPNAWGLNPVQLAQLLGFEECANILQRPYRKKIKVLMKGEEEIRRLDIPQFEEVFGLRYLQHQVFSSYEFLKKVLRNCPLLLRTKFWGGENRTLGAACEMELAAGYVENVSIQWINEGIGYGVFAAEDLNVGDYIGEYTGVVRQTGWFKPELNEYCYHYPTRFFSLNYILVDALQEGNETRFLNHSDAPNLEPACVMEGDLLHIVFFAKYPISGGTQLTYDYGKDFWKYRPGRKQLL